MATGGLMKKDGQQCGRRQDHRDRRVRVDEPHDADDLLCAVPGSRSQPGRAPSPLAAVEPRTLEPRVSECRHLASFELADERHRHGRVHGGLAEPVPAGRPGLGDSVRSGRPAVSGRARIMGGDRHARWLHVGARAWA
jgi:hypothetical protein